jgi:hypothetical protein
MLRSKTRRVSVAWIFTAIILMTPSATVSGGMAGSAGQGALLKKAAFFCALYRAR